jgi:hypothetical protein
MAQGESLVNRITSPLLLALLAGAPLAAQSLPTLAPLNPMAQMRSGLTTLPWFGPERPWHLSFTADYGNAIEYTDRPEVHYVLDAELLATRLLVARNLGPRGFVLAEASLHGSYNGFLDGFLDWYHDFTGLHVAARSLRPTNAFAYQLRIGEKEFHYQPKTFLGDVRVGGGVRFGRGWQSAFWMTIPTSSAPSGYRKGQVSANAHTMYHRDFGKNRRFTYEGSIGVGNTPIHGELREWQRSVFLMVTQGLRARLIGPFHAYANVFYDTPYYRNTGTPELDKKELTLDAGALFRFKKGPTWLLGMTQDLAPSGPAIDVAFRLGAYW